MARALSIGGALGIEDVLRGADGPVPLRFARGARARVAASAFRVASAVAHRQWVYGVTTGFGSNAVDMIPAEHAKELQENLLVSHALGDGPLLPDEVVRLALLLRVHALARGCSGIRLETLLTLVRLYENDILAEVPSRGSVGASGDLAPLAHLALPLIAEGRVRVGGRRMTAKAALERAGIERVELSYKEGLALVNGMQITLALGLHALRAAERLVRVADTAAALTLEALAGRSAALDPRVHEIRPHPGQAESARRMRSIIRGSRLVDAPYGTIEGKRRAPQDAYGVRCAPQVHGAVADGVAYAREVLGREVNSVTDNPVVVEDDILSGGNFHGEPLGLAMDHMRLCVHELGSISERRTATLVDPQMNEGLPAYLAPHHGLHSGFMIPQYVAASLVSEAKTLCFPSTADSIPTGANIEDHVSMATTAARRTLEVVDLVTSVLSLELMAAAQAIDLRTRSPSRRTTAVVAAIREALPFREKDALWKDALPRVKALVRDGTITAAAGLERRTSRGTMKPS